ncbi:hypothetical protein [Sorangium sp. So ce1153]|uniref:hypothetical protein n=1 Tax=Sorangium sp. So ce1153 TaxID=3133333 RepID=UPI003F604FDE
MGSHALAVLSAPRRSSASWAAAALLGLGTVILATQSCGNDAVGVDACRQIERARCEAAAVCPEWVSTATTDDPVKTCIEFYWDQCLHGVERDHTSAGTGNAQIAPEPTDAEVQACVAAVGAARDCASAKVASMAECPAAPLAESKDDSISPCVVITQKAHLLEACAFVLEDDGGAGGSGAGASGSGAGASGSGGGAGGSGGGAGGSGGGAGGSGGGAGGSGGGAGGSGGGAGGSGGGAGGSGGGAGGSADP